MANVTIPASITIPEETFNEFTDALGYQTMVEDPADENNMIENPETRMAFAQRLFKEQALMPWLMQFAYKRINREVTEAITEQGAAQRQAAYDEVAQGVTIG